MFGAGWVQGMHEELDIAVGAMFKKVASDSSAFIRDDVDTTIQKMIESVKRSKALGSVIAGAQNKSVYVRRLVVGRVTELIDLEGPKILNFREAERMLVCLTRLTGDKEGFIRYQARVSFAKLSSFDNFDKVAKKSLSEQLYKTARGVVDKIQKSGVGNPPSDPKARVRTGTTGSQGRSTRSASSVSGADSPSRQASASDGGGLLGSRNDSATSTTGAKKASARSRLGSTKRKPLSKLNSGPSLSSNALEELTGYLDGLTSKDWKARETAVTSVEAFAIREVRLRPRIFPRLNPRFLFYDVRGF